MQYCTREVLVFNSKVGYNTVITLEVLVEVFGRLVTLPQKWTQKKTKLY